MVCILIAATMALMIGRDRGPEIDCASFSVETCPAGCVICPPCKACSSISCQEEAFCRDMGFGPDWFDSIKDGLDGR